VASPIDDACGGHRAAPLADAGFAAAAS
jgi:hypothetical protein